MSAYINKFFLYFHKNGSKSTYSEYPTLLTYVQYSRFTIFMIIFIYNYSPVLLVKEISGGNVRECIQSFSTNFSKEFQKTFSNA